MNVWKLRMITVATSLVAGFAIWRLLRPFYGDVSFGKFLARPTDLSEWLGLIAGAIVFVLLREVVSVRNRSTVRTTASR